MGRVAEGWEARVRAALFAGATTATQTPLQTNSRDVTIFYKLIGHISFRLTAHPLAVTYTYMVRPLLARRQPTRARRQPLFTPFLLSHILYLPTHSQNVAVKPCPLRSPKPDDTTLVPLQPAVAASQFSPLFYLRAPLWADMRSLRAEPTRPHHTSISPVQHKVYIA